MYLLRDVKNDTIPNVPEIPLTYYEENYKKLLLWMSPLLLVTVWVNIYILFYVILFLVKMYYKCVDKKDKTVCAGELNCKKSCEQCTGKIFVESYV